jgi:ribonuclease P protein component
MLGAVVPKRHARRAVTRSLLKRQIRVCLTSRAEACPQAWPPGIWVVRLRAPFDRAQFPSAGSGALRSAARAELDAVFDGVQRRLASGACG